MFQPLSNEHHAYTTSQQVKTCLLIPLHHLPQQIHTHHSEAKAQYVATWHLAVPMKRALWEPVIHVSDIPVHQIAAH